ncbi:hypothetical protein BV20DRAFT_1031184 [Pilatotrama ljubarskyi]|nr:hypothetical protein BV20DRAFT_1031184 [Pilatotrama ljubarskyi]
MPSDATEAALGLLGLTAAFSIPQPPPPAPASASTSSTVPAKRKQPPTSASNDDSSTGSDTIDCICGLSYDDGFSIACDACARWCHAACFQIDEHQVPDEWLCWLCDPRPVDKDRAVKIQRARQRAAAASANTNGKRRASPGVERKTRRPSGVAGEAGHGHTTNKRKRRASITAAALAQQQHQHQAEDEHVDIDEPWQQTYVHITKDIVKSDDARDRLRRVAADWRGVTAISPSPTSLTPGCATPALLTPDAIPSHPPIALQPLPNNSTYPSLFAHGSTSVRPPSYAVHATQPIPSSKLIAPYPSTIISTAAYLADPLNAYAHLGMPKPFVHLIGPPLDVALDSRFTGDQSRFVRSGCRPNAVIRPVLCPSSSKKPCAPAEDSLSFGIFALRDLKANEEVVLGWEWDDGNVVHHLPALIESPFAFPPHQVQHFRNQMTSMLHALASTFTTCACGAKARDCALARMAEFVENQTPLTPSPSPPSQFTKEKLSAAARGKKASANHAHARTHAEDGAPVDLGPLIGVERGFRTRERIPFSGGMGGVEMVPPPQPQTPTIEIEAELETEAGPSRAREYREPTGASGRRVSFPDDLLSPPVRARKRIKGKDRKGKARADEDEVTEESDADAGRARAGARARASQSDAMDTDDESGDASPPEEKLPPKLRKTWIRQSAERLHERRRLSFAESNMRANGATDADAEDVKMAGGAESLFDSRDMPPPPVPPSRTPPLSNASTNHSRHHPPAICMLTSTPASASTSLCPPSSSDAQASASPSASFSKLSLLSPVVPASSTSPSSNPQSLPQAQAQSDSESTTSPPVRKRKSASSPQPPAEDKVTKKAAKTKAKARKEKEKPKPKEMEKDKDKDRSAAPRSPSTPVTPLTPAREVDQEPAMLQPSLVRKESVAAKRKKSASGASTTKTQSASPKVVVKEVEVSPRVPCTGLPSPATAQAGLPSPASVASALPAPTSATPAPEPILSAPLVQSPLSLLSAAAESREHVEVPPPQLQDPKEEDAMQTDPDPPVPTPAEAEAVIDVQMADEPASHPGPVPDPESHEVRVAPLNESTLPTPAAGPQSRSPPPDRPPSPSLPAVHAEPREAPAPPPSSEAPAELSREETPVVPAVPERPKSPSPPPPPPPKVKLSLKDFAMRKKKQREEQAEKEKEKAIASPVMDASTLPPSEPETGAEGERAGAGAAVGEENAEGSSPHPEQVTKVEVAAEPGLQEDTGSKMVVDEAVRAPEQEVLMVVDAQPIAPSEIQRLRSPSPPPIDPSPVPFAPSPEPDAAEQAVVPVKESPPSPPVVIDEKMEVSFPRPRTPTPVSPRSPPRKTSPSPRSSIDINDRISESLRAKVELLEDRIPNGFVAPRPRSPYSPGDRSRTRTPPPRDRFAEPLPRVSYRQDSRTPPPATSPKLGTRASAVPPSSQEDGEIFSPPPPKAPPLAPRSHTPPTQPRSFYAGAVSPPPRRSPPPPVRRPLHPASYRNTATGRPLPSAPRALRVPGAYGAHAYNGGGQNAPYYAPRGPSADRERDRERDRDRDRDRDRPVRDWGGRDRGDSERTWIPGPSRGRGRGTWGR